MHASSPSLALDIGSDRAVLLHDGQPVRSWPVMRVATLSTERAREISAGEELLVIERGSPGALELLRAAGRSFATMAGEWYLVESPGLLVVQPPRGPLRLPPSPARPLSTRTARVARWLLLHPDAGPMTIGQLARCVDVSEATSSRACGQLLDRGLLKPAGSSDARERAVVIRNPAGLLDAITNEGPWRRAPQVTWDIGAHTNEESLDLIRAELNLPYRVGGLAGAALITPLVEPSTVTLWIPEPSWETWQQALRGNPSRPAPGRVTARAAPDPVILSWGTMHNGLRVADDVQLYIDCHHAGERAIDIAEAMRLRILGPQ